MGISITSVIRFTATFMREFFFPDKSLNAVNDSGLPLVLGNPNRGYNIRHVTSDGTVYIYKSDGWYNSETGKTFTEELDNNYPRV